MTDDLDEIINQQLNEKSEMGEIFDNLDNDVHDEKRNVSNIDFNTRLSETEIKGILVFDEFKRMGILPSQANLTGILKRLKVSLDGKGRNEKVTIATAGRDATLSGRSGGVLGKLFTRRE